MSRLDTTRSGQPHWREAEEAAPALEWPEAPEAIRLERGQVHLWAAALNEFVDEVPKLAALLSSAEHARAEKLRLAEDRDRYVIRHGLLRLILSRYLEQPASRIEFRYGAHGKPEVRSGSPTRLFFNTSRSGDLAVCAVTSACPIGVDVERTREIPEIEDIARRFFLPRETQALMARPAYSRLQSFYNCWTRKEALLKATGEGITESLTKVEVTLLPEDKPGVVFVSGDPQARERWQLQPFSPARGYLGCVAYRNVALVLCQWRVATPAMPAATP